MYLSKSRLTGLYSVFFAIFRPFVMKGKDVHCCSFNISHPVQLRVSLPSQLRSG